jgi:hypothetical protein
MYLFVYTVLNLKNPVFTLGAQEFPDYYLVGKFSALVWPWLTFTGLSCCI